MKYCTDILLDGLMFPEGPRWHDGKLWFSDMYAGTVNTVDLMGRLEMVAHVAGQPFGLGWLPDGRLLVVSMTDRRLLRMDVEGLTTTAELSDHAPSLCNDMVVDRQGRAYIGNFGFDLFCANPVVKPTALLLVTPEGTIRVVGEDLLFPNGTAITPDERTLIVAETFGARLSAYTILPDGALADRYIWAELPASEPDGICLDAEGAIWVAAPNLGEVLRVREGGEIIGRIIVATRPYACMLGGPERRHLFVLTAPSSHPEECARLKAGRIEMVRVDVPGAGLP